MRFVENQRLITARLSKCWNQQDAAIACKVGKRSYCRWESGECDPSLASLRLLMDGFGLQADDLGYAHLVTYPLPQDQQGETSTESESDEQEQGRPQSSLILTLTREQATTLSALLKGGHMDKAKRRTLSTILAAVSAATTAPQALTNPEPWERLLTGRPADVDTTTLDHFQGLTQSCWGLSNSSQLDIAEQVLSSFLPRLIDTAPYNPAAAGLASEGLQLQSILVAHRLKISDKITLCQQQ